MGKQKWKQKVLRLVGAVSLMIALSASGALAATVTWTGNASDKLGNSELNFYTTSGTRAPTAFAPGDNIILGAQDGPFWTVTATDITLVGDANGQVQAGYFDIRGGTPSLASDRLNYTLRGDASLVLTDGTSNVKGMVKRDNTGFTWFANNFDGTLNKSGTGALKTQNMNVFDMATGGGSSTTTLKGDFKFAPTTATNRMTVSLNSKYSNTVIDNDGKVTFERADLNNEGTTEIKGKGALIFTGATTIGIAMANTVADPVVKLGDTGSFRFTSPSQKSLRFGEDKADSGEAGAPTITANGAEAVRFDGETQELRTFKGTRQLLSNGDLEVTDVTNVMNGSTLAVRGGDYTMTISAAALPTRQALVMNAATGVTTVQVGGAGQDKFRGTLAVTKGKLDFAKTSIVLDPTYATMTLNPGVQITAADATTVNYKGLDLNLKTKAAFNAGNDLVFDFTAANVNRRVGTAAASIVPSGYIFTMEDSSFTAKDKAIIGIHGTDVSLTKGSSFTVGKNAAITLNTAVFDTGDPRKGSFSLNASTLTTGDAPVINITDQPVSLVAKSIATLGVGTKLTMKGGSLGLNDSTLDVKGDSTVASFDGTNISLANASKGIFGNNLKLDVKAGSLSLDKSTLTAGNKVTATFTGSPLTMKNTSVATFGNDLNFGMTGASISLDNSTLTSGSNGKITVATGNLTMAANSKADMGNTTAVTVSGAVSLNNSQMTLAESAKLSSGSLTMAANAKLNAGLKSTVTNTGAATLTGSQLLIGEESSFSTGSLSAKTSTISLGQKGKVTSTGLAAFDAGTLLLNGDSSTVTVGSLTGINASSLTQGKTSAFTSAGDVSLNNSKLVMGDEATFKAAKVSVTNGGLLQVGDGSTMTGTSYSLNKGTLYMGSESRLTTTDLSLVDSTLKFKPGNSGAFMTSANRPTMTGANALNFQAVPNGTFTIVHFTDTDPLNVFTGVNSTDTFTGRVTVNGAAITTGGRVQWKGLAITDKGKTIVASAIVDNTKLGYKTGANGHWNYTDPNWTGSSTTFMMGDQATFTPTAATSVILDNNITAGDVIADTTGGNLTLTGKDLYVNGDNVVYDKNTATPGTGTLTKKGTNALVLSGVTASVKKGDIQAGSLNLLNGGIAGLASDNRGVITVQSGAGLVSDAASTGNNTIGAFGDVTMKKGSALTLGKGLVVNSAASLTLEEGVLKVGTNDFANTGTMVADGYGYNTATPGPGVTLSAGGNTIGVAATGRWGTTGVANYNNNMTVNVANKGLLGVFGNGSHVFKGNSALNMADGSVLFMDLTGRTSGAASVAAIDTTGATGGTIKGVTVMVASKDAVNGEYLVLNSGSVLNKNEFKSDVVIVDSNTLKLTTLAAATDTATIDYTKNTKQAWLSAALTPTPGPGPDPTPSGDGYTNRFWKRHNNGRPNVEKAVHQYIPATFADQVARSSSWYKNGGDLLTTKEILANEILKDSKNMTPEGALSAAMANLQSYTSLRSSFLGQLFAGTPSVTVSTNSLQFAGLDSPHSAERMLGSFRGSSGLQAQAQSDRLNSSLTGMGDLIASNYQSTSLFNNWKPAQESTRGMLTNADQFIANAVNDKVVGYGLRFFGGYLGSFSNEDSHGGYAGYDSTMNGFMLGAAMDFNEHFSAGGFVAYTTGETDMKSIDSTVDTDATQVGLALTYKVGNGFRVTGDAGYGHFDNDYSRDLDVFKSGDIRVDSEHKASADQDIWSLGLTAAFDWNPEFSPATTITPYAELRYTNSDMDSFTESGDILPTHVNSKSYDSVTSAVGVALSHDFLPQDNVVLTPRVSLGWVHEYCDTDMSASTSFVNRLDTVGSFKTRSVDTGTDRLQAGASFDALILNGNDTAIGLKLMYGTEVGANGINQNVFGGIEFRF